MTGVPTAQAWFDGRTSRGAELLALREIALAAGLVETVKWKHPCYTDAGKNIVLIGEQRDQAILSLLKGALVDDPRGRLVQPGQDRSGRYLAFPSLDAIETERAYTADLIAQAIEVERAGRRVPPLPDTIDYVEELREKMASDEVFRAAFEALTPGRRRHYNLHFGKAKKAVTRRSRIEQATARILDGKGLRDCICGRSRRMPQCDGSHRHPA